MTTHGLSPEDELVRASQSANDKRADAATTGRSIDPGEGNAGVAFCRRSLESGARITCFGPTRRMALGFAQCVTDNGFEIGAGLPP